VFGAALVYTVQPVVLYNQLHHGLSIGLHGSMSSAQFLCDFHLQITAVNNDVYTAPIIVTDYLVVLSFCFLT